MKVSILMPTYAHERTIAQAIESVIAQQVNFSIELLINDDCSPDKTYEIAAQYAAQYPQLIRVFHQDHNQGLMRNYQFLLDHTAGEYIAILESDDYWTDPLKLQKQVDYLDAHPDTHLSFSRANELRDNGKFRPSWDASYFFQSLTPYDHVLYRNIICSPTVCFRKSAFDQYCKIEDYLALQFKTFDYPVWLSLLANGNLHYLPEITAVYRVSSSSISHTSDLQKRLQFEDSVRAIQAYIIQLYGRGNLTKFQLRLRQAVVYSRVAWRLRHPFLAAKCFASVLFFRGVNE